MRLDGTWLGTAQSYARMTTTTPRLIVAKEHIVSSKHEFEPLGFIVRDVSDLSRDPDIDIAVLLLDLSNLEHFYSAKESIASLQPRETIFVIDTKNRIERIHAMRLRCTHLMERTSSPAEIAAYILELRATRQSDVTAASVSKAADGLGATFDTYRSRTALDDASVNLAVSNVLEGVAADSAGWIETVRTHHDGTFQHCLLVTGYMAAFANGLGMRLIDKESLTTAALLHDIGKMSVPVAILDKPGKLTAAELEVIRKHPENGHEYLTRHSSMPHGILHAVLHHHEFLDGSGYPGRLAGADIPDLTRMLTICDINAALVERRGYKEPMLQAEAAIILADMARSNKLDGDLVRAFTNIVQAPS